MTKLVKIRTAAKSHQKRPTVRAKAGAPKRLTTEEQVFDWLFDRLNQSEPRATVSFRVASKIKEFRDLVSRGISIPGLPLDWEDIILAIDGNDIRSDESTTLNQYSIKLLILICWIGVVMDERGDYLVPRQKVIQLMANYVLDGRYVSYRLVSGRWYLESTIQCIKTFGIEIQLRVTGPEGDLWDLSNWFD